MDFENLLDFKGRNPSAERGINLLSRCENVYVMDNHKLALWCWFQHVKETDHLQLLHIDAHYDLAITGTDKFPAGIESIKLQEYISSGLSWDNYLSYYLRHYPQMNEGAFFFTHRLGEQGKSFPFPIKDYEVTKLLRTLQKIVKSRIGQWIINIDLDFFFQIGFRKSLILFSPDYIQEIFLLIRTLREQNQVKVMTIALSPECCAGAGSLEAGWAESLSLCQNVLQTLGMNFDPSRYQVAK